MKKLIVILFLIAAGFLFAASFDNRSLYQNQGTPVFRVEVPQLSRDNGDATDVSTTVNLNGTIKQITVGVNDNTGNRTVTVQIIDDNGSILFTTETIAEATESAPVVQHFMTESATDLPLALPVTGTVTINAVLSGDPGSSGMTVDVTLYGD